MKNTTCYMVTYRFRTLALCVFSVSSLSNFCFHFIFTPFFCFTNKFSFTSQLIKTTFFFAVLIKGSLSHFCFSCYFWAPRFEARGTKLSALPYFHASLIWETFALMGNRLDESNHTLASSAWFHFPPLSRHASNKYLFVGNWIFSTHFHCFLSLIVITRILAFLW